MRAALRLSGASSSTFCVFAPAMARRRRRRTKEVVQVIEFMCQSTGRIWRQQCDFDGARD